MPVFHLSGNPLQVPTGTGVGCVRNLTHDYGERGRPRNLTVTFRNNIFVTQNRNALERLYQLPESVSDAALALTPANDGALPALGVA